MFTGIVAEVGTVRKAARTAAGLDLTIASAFPDLEPGESVAVDGACLTVESATRDTFEVHLVRTSLDRTRFAEYAEGRRVNLERALRMGERLGGHLVQGHVDGIGTVESVEERDDAWLVSLRVPDEVARVSVSLGSITVDGVSLTVNAKPDSGRIQISLIPFTLQHTTLGERQPGDRVHLEADTIGKYVRALMEEQRDQ
ncbi:MAG TPA: riboflavin synthase [Gemmatimonadales bacterium]|nr:riboflavin synthase [Gemmatimonadales bacterium]